MYALLRVDQNANIIDNLQWCRWSKIKQYFLCLLFFFYILVILETEVDANWKKTNNGTPSESSLHIHALIQWKGEVITSVINFTEHRFGQWGQSNHLGPLISSSFLFSVGRIGTQQEAQDQMEIKPLRETWFKALNWPGFQHFIWFPSEASESWGTSFHTYESMSAGCPLGWFWFTPNSLQAP